MSANNGLSRRQFLTTVVFGTLAGITAACTGTAPPAVPVTVTPAEPTKQPTREATQQVASPEAPTVVTPTSLRGELNVWGYSPLDKVGEVFQKKYPGVTFTLNQNSMDWGQTMMSVLASGSSLPDIITLEPHQIQLVARRGVLLDVTEMVAQHEKDLAPAKLAEARYGGKYLGMPGDLAPMNYWYRADIVDKAGIGPLDPNITYDAFLQISKTVKAKTGSSMFLMDSNFRELGTLPWQVALYSLGGNVSDESGEAILIDDEIGQQAMAYAKQAWDIKAGLDADWTSPASNYWSAVTGGELAGAWSPPWMRGFYESTVTDTKSGLGAWRNMLVPSYSGGKVRDGLSGGATLCGLRATKNPALVLAFMEFCYASMEGSDVNGQWGVIPPYLPWLNGNFRQTQSSLFEKGWDWTGYVVKAIEQMRTDYWRTPAYGIMMSSMSQFGLPMLKGEKSITEGMRAWGDHIRAENKKVLASIK